MFHVKHPLQTGGGAGEPPGRETKKAPAPTIGTGASRFEAAAYTSATQRPWMLQYSYTLRASSPSAMAKSATGASSGVSSTIW